MSDDFVTEKMLELQLENLSLKIMSGVESIFEEKISTLSDRMDTANITRRNTVFFEATGFEWADREKSRIGVQHGYAQSVEDDDTKKKVKGALIGGVGGGGLFAWFMNHLP